MAAFSDKPLQKYKVFAASFALVLVACAGRPVPLNSERIKQRFGSYGVEVLAADDQSRVSNLYSNELSGRVCRTYAVVRFAAQTNPAFQQEHAAITAGASLGSTFKARGWIVEKETLHIGTISDRDRRTQISSLMDISDNSDLAVHVYRLLVSKNGNRFVYAVIGELHHPDYLRSEDIIEIYGSDFGDPSDHSDVDELLAMMVDH